VSGESREEKVFREHLRCLNTDVYGHLLPDMFRDATDQMGALAPPEELEEGMKEEPEKEE
jgi:hypothetical protein